MTTSMTLLPPDPRDTGRRWWDVVDVQFGSVSIELVLESDADAVTGVHFGQSSDRRWAERESWTRDPKPVAGVASQLAEYGAGNLKDFELVLRPVGTGFQRDVWSALAAIPYGTTTSYGKIAAEVGRPKGSRAVGMAVGSNPIAIVIPCHRVIGADGSLTGFGGGLDNKVALLRLEGITAF